MTSDTIVDTVDDVVPAITQNQIQSWRKIFRQPKDRDPYQLFGVEGIISDIPYMMMNPLWDADPRITHVAIEEIIAWYTEEKLPFMWFITPQNPAKRLGQYLKELGLEKASMDVPGMYLDLQEFEPSNENPAYPIHNAKENDVDEMTDVMLQAFEVGQYPPLREGMAGFYQNCLSFPQSSHVVAKDNEKVIAAASIIYDAGVAGIYNVSVLPDYRRMGIATSMMEHLLQDAKQHDYKYSILHSSEKGKRVYEKMGYQTAFIYDRYLLRPNEVGLDY